MGPLKNGLTWKKSKYHLFLGNWIAGVFRGFLVDGN